MLYILFVYYLWHNWVVYNYTNHLYKKARTQEKYKSWWRKIDSQNVKHLTCINNLIRDNKIEELQLYFDNKLIIENYYGDIKDSLNFFKNNFNITK